MDYQKTNTAAANSLQSCLTLCDPIDGSPPGSPVPGILQARTLEWLAVSSSSAWKWKVKVKSLSRVQLLVTPWTAAYQAPPSMRFFQARVLEWGAIAFSGKTNEKGLILPASIPLMFKKCIHTGRGYKIPILGLYGRLILKHGPHTFWNPTTWRLTWVYLFSQSEKYLSKNDGVTSHQTSMEINFKSVLHN